MKDILTLSDEEIKRAGRTAWETRKMWEKVRRKLLKDLYEEG